MRLNFWKALLEKAKERTKLHAHISPQPYSWIRTGAGKSGIEFNYSVTQHDARVELYLIEEKDRKRKTKPYLMNWLTIKGKSNRFLEII